MKTKHSITACLALATLAVASLVTSEAIAVDEGWTVSFAEAKAQAAKEGKSILMEFTGSDWCPPCKTLQKNVLSQEVFKKDIPEHFVLLKLDSPRDKSRQTPEEIEQYKKLSEQYKVKGVPTIFLADAKGRPYWQTVGYSGDDAATYTGNLIKKSAILKTRDDFLAKAASASGTEKARLLGEIGEAIGLIDSELASPSDDEIESIIKLDADNKVGLKAKFEIIRKGIVFKAKLKALASERGDSNETIAEIDRLVAEEKPDGEALQEALFQKSVILFQTDKDAAKKLLLEAKKAAPESETGKRIDGILERFFN